jgi:hypothetical protein
VLNAVPGISECSDAVTFDAVFAEGVERFSASFAGNCCAGTIDRGFVGSATTRCCGC